MPRHPPREPRPRQRRAHGHSYLLQVTLVVNTASACGFTSQYKGLQELFVKYQDRGFTVIGMPCNQFGAQEKGGEAEIESFVCDRFKVSFPMTSKASSVHTLWPHCGSTHRDLRF